MYRVLYGTSRHHDPPLDLYRPPLASLGTYLAEGLPLAGSRGHILHGSDDVGLIYQSHVPGRRHLANQVPFRKCPSFPNQYIIGISCSRRGGRGASRGSRREEM